ncbi:MAG: cell wall-binding repeat-containing protein [Candidatus Andersenbacteria bacterium]
MLVAGAANLTRQTPTVRGATEDLVRLGGRDRYETSALASQQEFAAGAATGAVLANGQNFPDALTGGPLATALGGPLLLTKSGALSSTAAAELVCTLPSGRTVTILGGNSAVAATVASQVAALGYLVDRIAGADRYETAALVAERLHQLAGANVLPHYLVSGTNFPDALSVAPLAAQQGAPILLTKRDSLPSHTLDHLTLQRAYVGVVTLVGGTAAVSQAVQDFVGSNGFGTDRISGTDRYGTSRAVADRYVSTNPAAPTGVGLASGTSFADALSAAPLLARQGWPVLLVKKDLNLAGCLTTADYLQDNAATIAGGFVHGGTSAVTAASETFAEELIDGSRQLNCSGPTLAGCSIYPPDNPWNTDISSYPVHANSAAYIASINAGRQFLHADFGSNPSYGIPITVVPQSQPLVPMSFDIPDESDPGPYPYPSNTKIEAGSDQHVLVLQQGVCQLYESANSIFTNPGWHAYAGAKFDLSSNALRTDYFTSADAAGLPMLPGLARFDEVAGGSITHALRFTVSESQRAFIHPATHYASSDTSSSLPPMGLRLRLKSSFDTSSFYGEARVVLEALKKYGMIVADNGADWFISGATDSRWDDTDLDQLKTVPGSAFEAVETGPLIR